MAVSLFASMNFVLPPLSTSSHHHPFSPPLLTAPSHHPFSPPLLTTPSHHPFSPPLLTAPPHLSSHLLTCSPPLSVGMTIVLSASAVLSTGVFIVLDYFRYTSIFTHFSFVTCIHEFIGLNFACTGPALFLTYNCPGTPSSLLSLSFFFMVFVFWWQIFEFAT